MSSVSVNRDINDSYADKHDDRSIRVLLIEDDPGDARLIREMLESEDTIGGHLPGFELECVERLSDGLERLKSAEPPDEGDESGERRFDLLLLDLLLPDSKGLETFLKARAGAPGIPVVVLTVLDDEEMGVQAVSRGAQDYLVKGETDAKLLARSIIHAVERKRIETDLKRCLGSLEDVVEERTLDLKKANRYLRHEIEERRKAESAMRESEAKNRALLQAIPDLIFLLSREGVYLDYRASNPEDLLVPPEEFLGRHLDEVLPPEVAGPFLMMLESAAQTGEIRVLEYMLKIRGAEAYFEARIVPYDDDRLLSIVRNITKRKKAEISLRESEARYRGLFDSTPVAMYRTTTDGRILDANPAMASMYAYPDRETLLKAHADDFYINKHEREMWKSRVERDGVMKGFEMQFRRFDGQHIWVRSHARAVYDEDGQVMYYEGASEDITDRKRMEDALRQRNKELALLNMVGQAFTSNLDLDYVLSTVLDEVRRLLDVLAGSIWLIDRETDELVCEQVTEPQDKIVRGWRLSPGQGIAGWVARHGRGVNVPDTRLDKRHYKDVDRQIDIEMRSILSVPLWSKGEVIGVLQLVDTVTDRFDKEDMRLLESLATSAAVAIDNARLYEKVRQNAETMEVLLEEVNHRVKNNLSTIIGLLYAERHHAGLKDEAIYKTIIEDLISRVQGLSTVHSLLSESRWEPLLLSDLSSQVIHSSLHALPVDKQILVEVSQSPARVEPKQANGLAMVVNELATNTAKYALRGRNAGKITVHIEVDGNTVTFVFRDDGPGYPEDVLSLEEQNVGLYLIKTIVCDELKGSVSLRNEGGAVATIRFELAPAHGEVTKRGMVTND